MRKYLLLLILLSLSSPSFAAIALDTSAQGNGSVSTVTLSITVGAGLNRILIAALGSDVSIDSVVYNTTEPMTKIIEQAGGGGFSSIWYVLNPSTGAHNVVATWTGSHNAGMGLLSLNGVSQTFNVDSSNGGAITNNNTTTLTTSTLANNSWTVSAAKCNFGGAIVTPGGQTEFMNQFAGFYAASYNGPKTPPGAVTHTYSNVTGFEEWSESMASFAPVETGDFLDVIQ